jgi:ribosomal protein L21E
MRNLQQGDRVRIDIPDRDDPDFERFHGETGEIVAVIEDDAESVTGDVRDGTLYRVQVYESWTMDFRWRDLRPIEE